MPKTRINASYSLLITHYSLLIQQTLVMRRSHVTDVQYRCGIASQCSNLVTNLQTSNNLLFFVFFKNSHYDFISSQNYSSYQG
ncbi:MAG: hypothetical protein F6K47_13855 [Symploca sp. SIO2E6]|nr:hypothetical protein [Symploca sp. SIO2E6]